MVEYTIRFLPEYHWIEYTIKIFALRNIDICMLSTVSTFIRGRLDKIFFHAKTKNFPRVKIQVDTGHWTQGFQNTILFGKTWIKIAKTRTLNGTDFSEYATLCPPQNGKAYFIESGHD